jgi:sterol desaturase/sphingolipid hydroxylase (fatty acid hydroxylase superfamily)
VLEGLKRILAWLLYPALVIGGVSAVYLAIGRGVAPVASVIVLQIAMMPVVALLERWMPEHRSWNVDHDDTRTDALYFIISGAAIAGLVRLAIFSGTPSVGIWPSSWPLLAQLALAIVVSDLGSYGTHILTHKKRWLFPIHAPHHSARRLYWLNATRMHPFDEVATVTLSLLPLAVLGASPSALALFDAFAIVHLMIQHSNIRLRHGPLSHVLATAEFHRWHHSKERVESECNYAAFVSLWDHIFGTFRMPAGQSPPEEVGLYDGARIGDSFSDQLRAPFRAWAQRAERPAANRGSDVSPHL